MFLFSLNKYPFNIDSDRRTTPRTNGCVPKIYTSRGDIYHRDIKVYYYVFILLPRYILSIYYLEWKDHHINFYYLYGYYFYTCFKRNEWIFFYNSFLLLYPYQGKRVSIVLHYFRNRVVARFIYCRVLYQVYLKQLLPRLKITWLVIRNCCYWMTKLKYFGNMTLTQFHI